MAEDVGVWKRRAAWAGPQAPTPRAPAASSSAAGSSHARASTLGAHCTIVVILETMVNQRLTDPQTSTLLKRLQAIATG